MGRKTFLGPVLAVTMAALLPAPASAQCRLCDTPATTRSDPVSGADVKLQIETSLNFDRLILNGQGEGIAVIRPDGSSLATGALSSVGPRAMVGTVSVHGEAGRAVRVEIPRQIELYSLGGGQITFDEVQSDLPSAPRLDSSGNLVFRFGGRIRLTGDSEGDFRGDLPITVEYL